MTPLVLYPEPNLGPTISLIVAYGVCGVFPLLILLYALVSWAKDRVLAARTRAVEQSDGPLKDGRTVVRGTVELARGAPHAIRVEVEQSGSDYKYKNNWKHKWTELQRRTLAHPFYVRDQRGQRIRVEPGADVQLIDDLDEVRYERKDHRVRAAAITPGEEVYAFGVLGTGQDPELGDGYRGAGIGPVLRAPGETSMLVASTSPSGRFKASAFVHGLWAIGFAIVLCVLQLVNVMQTVRLLNGETVTASLVSKRHFITKGSKGSTIHHYEVTLQTPRGVRFTEEIEQEPWEPLQEGARLAVVQVPGSNGYELLGDRPTVHVMVLILPTIFLSMLVLAYYGSRLSIRPWYERKVEDQGSGRMPEQAAEPRVEPAIPQ